MREHQLRYSSAIHILALCAMSIIDYLARSVDRQAKGLIIKDIAQLSGRIRTTFSVLSVGQA